MLVSHRYKFIYLKTFKTAGTSVNAALEHLCLPRWRLTNARPGKHGYTGRSGIVAGRAGDTRTHGLCHHATAQEVRDVVGDGVWDSYLKVANVRNPFDKLVSWYFYRRFREGRPAEQRHAGAEIDGFRDWLAGYATMGKDRARTRLNGAPIIDTWIRFETLEADIAALLDQLGAPRRFDLPALKGGIRTDPTPFWRYYDRVSAAIVQERFAFEFDQLGYDRDSWMGPPSERLAHAG